MKLRQLCASDLAGNRPTRCAVGDDLVSPVLFSTRSHKRTVWICVLLGCHGDTPATSGLLIRFEN